MAKLPTTDITMTHVKDRLGETTYKLSELCQSDNVVANAISSTYVSGSTDQDRLNNLSSAPYKLGDFRDYGIEGITPDITNYSYNKNNDFSSDILKLEDVYVDSSGSRLYLLGNDYGTEKADLPNPTYSNCTINYDGRIWSISGTESGSGTIDKVYSTYNLSSWTIESNDNLGDRIGADACVYDGDMFISCGWDDNNGLRNDVLRSSDGVTWTTVLSKGNNDLPNLREHKMESFNGYLFIIGGAVASDMESWTNDITYTSDLSNWSTYSPSFHARGYHNTVIFKDKLWLVGGEFYDPNVSSSREWYNDIWYTTDGFTWTELTSSASFGGRSRFALQTDGRVVWLFGGEDSSGVLDELWYTYDMSNWYGPYSINIQKKSHLNHNDASLFGNLTIIGGLEGGTIHNSTYILSNRIFEYTINGFDISSAAYTGNSTVVDKYLGSSIVSMFFKPDGSKIYLLNTEKYAIEINVTSSWDITSLQSYVNYSYDYSGRIISTVEGIRLSGNGNKLYILANNEISQWSLDTSWSFNIVTYEGYTQLDNLNSHGMHVLQNRLYYSYYPGSPAEIIEFVLESDWSVINSTYNDAFIDLQVETSNSDKHTNLFVELNEGYIFTTEATNSLVYQYNNLENIDTIGDISFEAGADSKSYSITPNGEYDWTITSYPSWLTLSSTSGTGNTTITASVNDYYQSSDRSGTISLSYDNHSASDTATVTQYGAYVDISDINVSYESSTYIYSIIASKGLDWTLSESTSWFSLNPTTGTGASDPQTVDLNVDQNTDQSTRSGDVTATLDGNTSISDVGTVTQDAAPSISLSVSPTSYNTDYNSDSFTLSISITSGYSWTIDYVYGFTGTDWFSSNQESGTGDANVTISIDYNSSGDSRLGSVIVNSDSTSDQAKCDISQSG